jgi:outer membrane protein, multidrug efflux system
MRGAIALTILAAALVGCAGQRPAAPAAAAITAPIAWRTDSEPGSPVEAEWWQAFGDTELSKIVATALAQNIDVHVAVSRVAEARAQFKLARAQRLPDLVGTADGGRDRDVNPGFGFAEEQTTGEVELAISYDVDLFGRLAQASAASRASLMASEAARDNVRLAVAASAASGYITLRAFDARLVVLRHTLAAREQSLHLAKRRADAGYASLLDLRQAEAEYRATEQLIPAAQLAISRQEDGLSLLLGEEPAAVERGVELSALTTPMVPASLPSTLLRRRPDIAEAEYKLVAADRSLDSARAAFMPSIELTASGGYVTSGLLVSNPIQIWSLGGSLLAPILDSGRLRAQQSVAAARRDQAAFVYRKTTLIAFREVEDALAAMRLDRQQEQAIAGQRDALAQSLTLATNRYRAGYSPYLEQLDAERALLSAELSLVQVQADRLSASVSLYQALGGGWDNSHKHDHSP